MRRRTKRVKREKEEEKKIVDKSCVSYLWLPSRGAAGYCTSRLPGVSRTPCQALKHSKHWSYCSSVLFIQVHYLIAFGYLLLAIRIQHLMKRVSREVCPRAVEKSNNKATINVKQITHTQAYTHMCTGAILFCCCCLNRTHTVVHTQIHKASSCVNTISSNIKIHTGTH